MHVLLPGQASRRNVDRPMTRRSSVPLAEVIDPDMSPRIIHGGTALTERSECWGGRTLDGVWGIEREDDARSDWLVWHLPSLRDGSWKKPVAVFGTLRACRVFIGSGQALRTLAVLKCSHPASARGTRPGGGYWHHETCSACTGSRVVHRADLCQTCAEAMHDNGP